MPDQRCRDLRVEYLDQPLGIGVRRPRLSWTAAGVMDACEIEVDRADGEPVWRSGRITSEDGFPAIEYAGAALGSNRAYRWRVRAWLDAAAEPTGWTTAAFETGLLEASDWRAAWIRPEQEPTALERWSLFDWIAGKRPDSPVEQRLRPVRLMRQRFRVRDGLVRARLYATAHGVYTARINGRPVGDQVLAPGFDSYRHRVSVQCYDVTALLADGDNVLGVALADGWWAGRIGVTGSSAQFGAETSATWQLHLDHADGGTELIVSGADVRSAAGPWAYADLFVGEHYDRRRELPGWDAPGFDDGDWKPVTVTEEDTGTLRPFTGEPVRRVLTLPAVTVTGDAEAGWIADFGQVLAGRVRLTLRAAGAGQAVTIEHTEALAADGSWFTNITGINKEQTDVYVTGGPGPETYEPEFTFHGFRYARIRGAVAVDEIQAVVLSSDIEWTGSFQTSDTRLDRLHRNVVWSQRGNFLSVPTDCPQRERAGWTGDIQVFAAAATNNAQVVPFLNRWLANLRADQMPDGRIPIMSPYTPWDAEHAATASGIGGIVAAAGWSDAIALVPWTLYERTGDRRILAGNLDAMLAWIEHQSSPGYDDGDHFGDWLTPSTMEGRPLHEAIGIAPTLTGPVVAPMFRAQTLTVTARAARVLGRTELADDLDRRAAAVRASFDPSRCFDVDLQGMYVLALAFDMLPPPLRTEAAARLAALVEARGGRLDTGFLSVPYLLDVLWDHGHRDLARRVLWQSEMPSWLYEVDRGATTVWESWDAIAPDGTVRPVSLNHYAFGCVDDWLYRRVAGIQPTSPGYRTVTIDPDLSCGVEWVRAHVGTPYGRLSVSWRRTGGAPEIEVNAPPGITVTIRPAAAG
ncbi:alpha-L-rhamnosidase [Actinoplanes lobatus]|uniref:alpha-L-rhamnosidase n=1 Tax=Actinoplanes lobatus TaxID=113568 RepID=A0A7W7HND2_9ACTN|nr:alpha-L-rhamnosidase [Actinoplanes lobatus]MBB4753726.1 alpha-L-rhamnosidase [Actinoplanes lobatus]GGN72826.1 alpha-L-rhamnosidase [Actinoplanes lobatus]GIE42121.1 alpha-L-rhamnosidase [Actinoplanes lobatus]